MNKESKTITKTCNDAVKLLNDIEEIIARAIKNNNCKPNKAGFTNFQDAGGIGFIYSLTSSMDYHLQRAKESQMKAQANYKNAGSATWWGENEHRSKVVAECIQEILQELGALFKVPEIDIATNWDDLRSVVKAVEIPLSSINEMRERQGLQPLTEK